MEIEVGIIMGSKSDFPIMEQAKLILESFGISSEVKVVSAHRTPEHMVEYAKNAANRGLKVIIAGAGGAAHLPGMTASLTSLPVIGVPIKSSNSIDGWDSILSILQMPNGIPVATVALNAAKNAGLLAARILASGNPELLVRMDNYRAEMKQIVLESQKEID
jgi:5-(carboxyamino)imidazole ribonucleotide mutase